MDNAYATGQGALSWLKFMDSKDGQIFRAVLGEAILGRLDKNRRTVILDAACGSGWLTKQLADLGLAAQGCDNSRLLIDYAKTRHPEINFSAADLGGNLPFTNGQFDIVTLCMATVDLPNLNQAAKNLNRILKPGGRLVAVIPNPYYAYPVGVWKRGLINLLFGKKPRLKLRPYQSFARQTDREFGWNGGRLTSYFYTLPEQLNAILGGGFKLNFAQDVCSPGNSGGYDLNFRLYRFPIFLLLEFVKI